MHKEFIIASIIVGLALALSAQAAKADTFTINGKKATKLQAIRSMIREPELEVMRCQIIELTDDAKVRNVKKIVKR